MKRKKREKAFAKKQKKKLEREKAKLKAALGKNSKKVKHTN